MLKSGGGRVTVCYTESAVVRSSQRLPRQPRRMHGVLLAFTESVQSRSAPNAVVGTGRCRAPARCQPLDALQFLSP
jgi:hypothetical protein